MFTEMIERVQTITISRLLKGRIVRVPAPMPARQPMPAQTAPSDGEAAERANNADVAGEPAQKPAAQKSSTQSAPVIGDAPKAPEGLSTNIGGKQIPKVAPKSAKVGRNDPCPCGSGKKYKDCCYWRDHK